MYREVGKRERKEGRDKVGNRGNRVYARKNGMRERPRESEWREARIAIRIDRRILIHLTGSWVVGFEFPPVYIYFFSGEIQWLPVNPVHDFSGFTTGDEGRANVEVGPPTLARLT